MPPRTRKAATPAPSLEDAAAKQAEAEVAVGTASNPPESGQEPGEQVEQLPEVASATPSGPAEDVSEGSEDGSDPEADADDDKPETPAPAAAAQTFHWESVRNDGTAPCHLCIPGGPPAGAGVFGCAHGQWVRVQDTV